MALPANWSTVALVGHLVTDANDPALDYTVQLVSSQSRLQDSVSHRVIFPKVDEATPAAGSGYFRIPIVVSDTDTDITPAGRSHKVTLLSGGRPIQSWFVTVDHTQAVQLRFGSDGTIVQSGGTLADAIWVTDLAQFTDAPTVTPIGGGVTTEDLAAYFTKTEADGRFSTPASTAAALANHVAASDPHSQYALDSDLTSGLAGKANVSALSAHTGNVSNPHSVTKTQVGLGNVANTAPADLPVSSATQSALDGKVDTSDARLTNQRVPTDASVTDAKVASNAAISADKTADGATNKVYTATEKTKLGGVAAGATANSTDTQLRDRSTHTGTQSADTVTDGSTNKTFLATERTKLSGIATGATSNATDANLRDRATHTGTQASTTISDFTEAVQDAVAALLGAGSNVVLNYDDAANTLTVSATGSGGTGLDAEQVRDAIGVALVGAGNVSVVVNDAADTITISTTATVNSTDAQLRDRSTHTGTQSADTLTDGSTSKAFLASERTKLAGIAAGATANDTDANLKNRANHTGSQAIGTVTGLQAALDAKTGVTVDGVFASTYNIDTTPVTYQDIDGTVPDEAIPAAIARDSEVAAGLAGKQPLDDDLTALAGLTPANDDVVQRKAGAWTNRTLAQLKTDIGATRTVIEYTAAGTTSGVAIPSNCLGALVTLVGGGGGGGGGRRGAAATVRGGGAGGGQGGVVEDLWVPASLLGATYTATVGGGGSGGGAATADNTNGGGGGGGGDTTFTSGSTTVKVVGGPGGGGGSTAGGTNPGYAGAPLQPGTGNGQSADAAGGAGAAINEGYSLYLSGGAAGGGITAADVAGNGGSGCPGVFFGVSGAAGGVVGGASPGAAQLRAWHQGFSGGGGAASKTAAAQNGAAGARCGGSGGGASLNGFNSGAGGAGGAGLLRVQLVFP